jgi:tripartite-type tricarboxylate transporter receptor subunit TctC
MSSIDTTRTPQKVRFESERRSNANPSHRAPFRWEDAMISRRVLILAAVAVGIGLAVPTHAQSYPDWPIKLVVPFPPGGPVDVTARILGQALSPIIGQPLIVENRGGASGAIGSKLVAAAEPDGYTLLCGNISSLVVTPVVNRYRDYDPAKAFAPIAMVTQNYEVLVVNPTFPAQSVKELIAYAKANPGKLNFGSAGLGNASHLAAELFKLRTGTDIVHVPYKGAADAVTGVLSGQVQMFFGDIGGVMPLIREGRLRALALSRETRSPEIPELPTMIESGVPDYVVLTYIGVVAPAATPRAIVDKLNATINASLRTPEVVAAAKRLSAELRPASAADFGAFLAGERDKWGEVVRQSGIKIQ